MKKRRLVQMIRLAAQIIFLGLTVLSAVGGSLLTAGVFLAVALIAGSFYCGWLCPFGLVQELMARIGRRILPAGRNLGIPRGVERWLVLSRYLILIAGILVFFGISSFQFFLQANRPYQTFIAVLNGNVAYIGIGTWIFLGMTLLVSVFVERPFCRYVCSEGARYGVASLARMVLIRRDADACVDCGACDRACPTGVRVSHLKKVRNPQCINCMKCISACPKPDALRLDLIFRKTKTQSKLEAKNDKEVA